MEVFSLTLSLPDEAKFQLEVNPDDTLLHVLQELFFFEVLPENDPTGNLIVYRFVLPETGKELALMTDFSGLISKDEQTLLLRIEQEMTVEEEAEVEVSSIDEGTTTSEAIGQESEMLSIVIRVMESKQEMEVEIPTYFTAGQLIDELASMEGIVSQDENHQLIPYHLIRLSNQESIPSEQSFGEAGIQAGETLGFSKKKPPETPVVPTIRIVQELSPPSHPVSSPVPQIPVSEEETNVFDSDTNILLQFPDQLAVSERTSCSMRIDWAHFAEYLYRKGFVDKSAIHSTNIRELIRISVRENVASPLLEIEQAVDIQSLTDGDTHAEWQIVLHPMHTGFTSLVIQVFMTDANGQADRKHIFFLNHAFEVISKGQEPSTSLWQEYESFSTLFWWSNWLKDQIIRAVASDATGKAIALLCNFLQFRDQQLYQSLLLLQSQWHESKNKVLKGNISAKSWGDTQKKIHFVVMELVADIENQKRLKPKRIRRHIRSINKVKTVAEKVG